MDEYAGLDFTLRSEEVFYDTVDIESFKDNDAQVIYERLVNQMHLIPFGEYLKRYIYIRAGFEESGEAFENVDIKEYQSIIIESFRENNTPNSFTQSSTKISALAKNWLTQNSANRNAVFLLGFGLKMTQADVSDFLVKVLRERDFDFKDPFEIICWYCFKNGLGYPEFSNLLARYEAMPENETNKYLDDQTVGVRDAFSNVDNTDGLMSLLATIKVSKEKTRVSVTAKSFFDELYAQTCDIIAEHFNSDEDEKTRERVSEYLDRVSGSDRLSPEAIMTGVQKIKSEQKLWKREDITEGDVEKFICCGVPIDGNGNLKKFSASTLAKHFSSKRLNRQRLRDINLGKADIDRFDLITLNFFVISQDEEITNNQKRFTAFLDSSNAMLNKCSMGEIYIANPYECFLLLCVLSDYPLGAYTDVLEKSFDEE